MEQYYYNTLTKPQQNSYNAIKVGLQSLAPSFPVPLLISCRIKVRIRLYKNNIILFFAYQACYGLQSRAIMQYQRCDLQKY